MRSTHNPYLCFKNSGKIAVGGTSMNSCFKIYFRFTIFLIFSATLIFSFNGCIDQCDTKNSTIALVEIDSLNKAFPINGKITFNETEIDTLKQTKTSTLAIPLDLTRDTTRFTLSRGDTSSYSFTFNYKRIPYHKGPDCGLDIKIGDLNISNISVITSGAKNRTITLLKTTVTFENAPNVKINFQ